MPYQAVMEVWSRLQSIPEDDRNTILHKPATTDAAADSRWRRCCAKYNISTKAAQVSADRRQYMRDYHRDRRIEELEEALCRVKERGPVWKTGTAQALSQVLNRRAETDVVSDGAVRGWFVSHMCGDCIRKIFKRVDANPFCVCEKCRIKLVEVLEVAAKGSSRE